MARSYSTSIIMVLYFLTILRIFIQCWQYPKWEVGGCVHQVPQVFWAVHWRQRHWQNWQQTGSERLPQHRKETICWQWNSSTLPSFCCCQVFCGKLSRELNQSLSSSLWPWKTIGARKCSYGDVCCRKWPYSCSGPILLYPTYPILSLFRLIH